jgi:hypothetical protein
VAGRHPRAAERRDRLGRPGAEEIVSRLADALLAQALRVALAVLESSDGAGVLARGWPPRSSSSVAAPSTRGPSVSSPPKSRSPDPPSRRASASYGTEFSFAKAFKRSFGIAPGTYRGQQHGVPGLGRDSDAAALAQ